MQSNHMIETFKQYLTFFSSLTHAQQALIVENTQLKHYAKNETLLSDVSECSGLIVVKFGQLRAFYSTEEGKQITLYRLLDGDVCIMSASCVLKNITFEVSLAFETDSEIYIIPIRIWRDLSQTNLTVQAYAMELMAARFSEVMWVMEQLVFKGIGERVATFLMEQSTLVQSDILTTTHEVVANNLSTAREVISRTLKHFESDGIIALSRGVIKIVDFKKLQALIA
ncbi:MAG: Crp/Fnr family transcriptional regulator [Hyphomonadaceae bacterium]|nr:Crp/Fnr family transcriptional regulator [Clostridia bacterium]